MPEIPENYNFNKTQDFDNFLNDQDFKKKYEDLKNRINEFDIKNEASKEEFMTPINEWIASHPLTVLTITFIGTTFLYYKLYQRLIKTSIYKANIMTLDYIENNIEIVRKTI